jgi:oxalate decarboxylase/phosphoglucose isomerase-like protein (cupin superfamily)
VDVPAAVDATLGAGRALRCVQHAGDVVYVPDGWGHGVFNHGGQGHFLAGVLFPFGMAHNLLLSNV